MKSISYDGLLTVINLLNSGLKLDDIVDSYGRPINEGDKEFFSYHKQAKRLIIKKAADDEVYRNNLINKFDLY